MIRQLQCGHTGARAWIAHSKLSKVWRSPPTTTSNALSYSFSQTSHLGIHNSFAPEAVTGGVYLGRMQAIGFTGMAVGDVGVSGSCRPNELEFAHPAGVRRVHFVQPADDAGPNSTTFTLAPILFPTQLRWRAGGFAAGVAKLGATLGVFLLPILKEKFGVPSVLGIVSAVSLLGLVVTLILGREHTE